jgi:cob(I)alamin adenosyltransferase
MRISKVTTKTGDNGKTSLGDGTRVSKDHPNINFLGDIDELNTHLGHAISTCDSKIIKKQLESIQQDLFNIGGESSMPNEEISLLKVDRITFLEEHINKMNKELPLLKEFILPGGDELCSRLHIVRAVCRRAERSCVTLIVKESKDKSWLTYLNRLSDFIFVLVRYLNQNEGLGETLWER